MNIVFFSMNDIECEALQQLVSEKLKELHSRDRNFSGAQVIFREEDDPGGPKVCAIDLSHYGEPVSVCKAAASYEQAANEALTELKQKVEQAVKPIPS